MDEVRSTTIRQLLLDEAIRNGDKMDPECIPLCDALNIFNGITTIASCCGHGYAPFRAYFVASQLEDLKPILVFIDESPSWKMRVSMATGNMEIYFVLEGPIGGNGYSCADDLAAQIKSSL
jgi:hypothetical protein